MSRMWTLLVMLTAHLGIFSCHASVIGSVGFVGRSVGGLTDPLVPATPGSCTNVNVPRSNSTPVSDQSNIHSSVPELLQKYGFPLEIHNVTTSDGYILTNHRIPSNSTNSPVVFLYHGIFCSSRDWFMQDDIYNTLPILLHLKGYDVWVGNMRGNNYSLGHTNSSYTTDNPAYWDFSVDDIALKDVPAIIDYITGNTGAAQINWIGYSLGTTSLFSSLVSLPSYQSKIKCFAGLAPVALTQHYSNDPVWALLASQTLPEQPFKGLMYSSSPSGQFFPQYLSEWMETYLPLMCNPNFDRPNLCGTVVSLLTGMDQSQLNNKMQPVIFGGFPSSISVRMLIQQLQGVIHGAGNFSMYDYQNPATNFQVYGQSYPKTINLTAFNVPTILYAGLNDALAPAEDVAYIVRNLPKLISLTNVSDSHWAHLDFIYGLNARSCVYESVLTKLPNCGL